MLFYILYGLKVFSYQNYVSGIFQKEQQRPIADLLLLLSLDGFNLMKPVGDQILQRIQWQDPQRSLLNPDIAF